MSERLVLGSLGRLAEENGDFPTASRRYEQAMAIALPAMDPRGEATIHSSLGRLAEAPEPKTAQQHYEQAATLYKKLQDTQGEAAMSDKLARLSSDSGQVDAALSSYEHAASLFRQRTPPDLCRARVSLQSALRLAEQHKMKARAGSLRATLNRVPPC